MKKFIFSTFLMIVPLGMFAQLKVLTDGRVTVNTTSTVTPANLSVGQNTYAYSGYQMGILSKVVPSSSAMVVGLKSDANASSATNYGRSFGVYAVGGNATSGFNYGVVGALAGSCNGAGVYGADENVIGYVPGVYAGYFRGNTYVQGTLTATSVVTPSDIRLKKNVESLSRIDHTLDNVLSMNVISYNYKERELSKAEKDTAQATTLAVLEKINRESANRHFGLSAQELQEIYPDLVKEGQDGYLSVNYIELVPILIRAIQELQGEIYELNEANSSRRAPEYTTTIANQTSDNQNVLYQNAPNPFKEQTSIRFKLADNVQDAAICFFDMTGKIIKKFPISSGMDSISVGGYELGEGMFLYSLIVNGQVIGTKRMVISK